MSYESILRLGNLAAIPATQLQTAEALETMAEAVAEVAGSWPATPPMVFLIEMKDLSDQVELPEAEPYGIYLHRVDHEPVIAIQRGLPALSERVVIRHELWHWGQYRAGRFEAWPDGIGGHWWASPAATRGHDEDEAVRFSCDARYWAERIAAGLAPPEAGWKITLERVARGRLEWRARRRTADGVIEELVPRAPSGAALTVMRDAAEAFLDRASRDPSVVDQLNDAVIANYRRNREPGT